MGSGSAADQDPGQYHQVGSLNRSCRSDGDLELIRSVLCMHLLDMKLCAFGIAQKVLEEVLAAQDCT